MSRIATTGQRLSRLTGPPASLVNPGTTDPLEATLAVPGLHVLGKLVADSKFSHYRCCLLGIVTWESSPWSRRHLVHLEGWEGGVRLRVVRTSVLAARRRRIQRIVECRRLLVVLLCDVLGLTDHNALLIKVVVVFSVLGLLLR